MPLSQNPARKAMMHSCPADNGHS